MPEPSERRAVARHWLEKAAGDLLVAEHTLVLGDRCPTDIVCFHAQQTVEKALKALLIAEDVPFPRTHSIASLVALVPVRLRPSLTIQQQEQLSDYAVTTRYPGEYAPIPLPEAREAIALASSVLAATREHLSG